MAKLEAGTLDTKYVIDDSYELSDYRISDEESMPEDRDATTNTTAKNLKEFIEKTNANKGYYIARYEASYDSGYNASGTTATEKFSNAKPLSKPSTAFNEGDDMTYEEGTLWTYITQAQSAIVSQNMYKNNNYVESDLINSYAWDTAIVYIQAMGNTNYANADRDTVGNISVMNTGSTGDQKCKIFDMAANAQEWSTESGNAENTYDEDPWTARGGISDGSVYHTSTRCRKDCAGYSNGQDISFRTIIYVK
mgnify:CR=1 FL=1